MYQLSQVFLEDKNPKRALAIARKARKLTCGDKGHGRRSARSGSPAGKPELCVQILTQEADIWRELGKFNEAVEVIKIKTSSGVPGFLCSAHSASSSSHLFCRVGVATLTTKTKKFLLGPPPRKATRVEDEIKRSSLRSRGECLQLSPLYAFMSSPREKGDARSRVFGFWHEKER